MESLHQPLLELQELDNEIQEAEARVAAFDPQLAEVEAPVTTLTREVETTRASLDESQTELRRLERNAEEKRATLKKYEDRLDRVRNVREESAVRTELDLVRRAVEADETDALNKMDVVRKVSLKLSELEKKLAHATAEVEPRRQELLASRAEAESALAVLRDKRKNQAMRLPAQPLRLYERVRTGRRRALVPLTSTGACGNCYNTLPIQEQNQVRQSTTLHTCEACGVILFPG